MTYMTATFLIDEFRQLADRRSPWENHWNTIAMYALPNTAQFDSLFLGTTSSQAIDSVVSTPVAADRSKNVYDMTSLWGIERLTSGMLTMKTPESQYWHGLGVDDDFGYEETQDEKEQLELLRNYMFRMRANPHTGFWPAHKSSLKSMCGFGDGWLFIEELHGARTPYRYEYVPLPDCYPGVGPNGNPNRMFRVRGMTADQIVKKWPTGQHGKKVTEAARDSKKKHNVYKVLHAVRPRDDMDKIGRIGAMAGDFASYYVLLDDKIIIAEGGFYEFPYVRYAWNPSGTSPFSEGPLAIALGEIKSLQEMAKNELLAGQMLLRPPLATKGKNHQRLNFNAGAVNPGLINGDGKQLFAPLNGGIRPDFAAAVMEPRRESAREMLYLNLWQILIDNPDQTATESLIRAQEKGELLGPVGISMSSGLTHMVDREIGILARKGAFRPGSPLEMPESLMDRNIAPQFTSPLDRLRRVNELVGINRLLEVAAPLMEIYPEIRERFDPDEILELAQDILGAPASILVDREEAKKRAVPRAQQQQAAEQLAATEAAGNALKAAGEGGAAAAAGMEAVSASDPLKQLISQAQAAA